MDYKKLTYTEKNQLNRDIMNLLRKQKEDLEEHAHKLVGKMYGYPECCIKAFCEDTKYGLCSGFEREEKFQCASKFWRKKHVPCEKCLEKIMKNLRKKYTKKELKEAIKD